MKDSPQFFLWLLIALIVAVSGYKFEQFFIHNDYTLVVNLNCDPAKESCFMMDCATDDTECDRAPYKKLETSAKTAPQCLLQRTCLDYTCPVGDQSCTITTCADDNLEEGERCATQEVEAEQTGAQPVGEEMPVAESDAQNEAVQN